jgi:NADP-reducing hydrogenase subunit HndD
MSATTTKCILCRTLRRQPAKKVQGVGILGPNNRGFKTHHRSGYETAASRTYDCVHCGQCIGLPDGALHERRTFDEVIMALT